MILLGAVFVGLAVGCCLEEVQPVEVFQVLSWIFGQFGHGDARDVLADDLPFEGVVIEKHHRVETNVQDGLDGAYVVYFCLPVGLEHGYVVELQDHVGMMLKRLPGCFLVVFRGHADDDAALAQFLYPHLELSEGFSDAQSVTQLDAFYAVVANDSAPDGVVEVEDEAFLELPPDGADNVHEP